MQIDEIALLAAAREVRHNAYVPYSLFPVGAALQTASGRVFAGANVDNASFPMTSCAEANAIGAMVSAGERRIAAMLVIGGRDPLTEVCTPCGGCRQRILEFADDETVVLLATDAGVVERVRFGELLPRSFTLAAS